MTKPSIFSKLSAQTYTSCRIKPPQTHSENHRHYGYGGNHANLFLMMVTRGYKYSFFAIQIITIQLVRGTLISCKVKMTAFLVDLLSTKYTQHAFNNSTEFLTVKINAFASFYIIMIMRLDNCQKANETVMIDIRGTSLISDEINNFQ